MNPHRDVDDGGLASTTMYSALIVFPPPVVIFVVPKVRGKN
jgi:hypothetical protein